MAHSRLSWSDVSVRYQAGAGRHRTCFSRHFFGAVIFGAVAHNPPGIFWGLSDRSELLVNWAFKDVPDVSVSAGKRLPVTKDLRPQKIPLPCFVRTFRPPASRPLDFRQDRRFPNASTQPVSGWEAAGTSVRTDCWQRFRGGLC